jgi:hypothetical protein
MVDIDDLRNQKDESDSGSGSSSESSSSKSSSSSNASSSSSSSSGGGIGEETGTFSLDEDDQVDPSGKTVSKTSKQWANDGAEFNFDAEAGEGLQQYANRQVKEVEELHENMREMAQKHMDNFDEFTLYFHALYLNFAQNRVGIAETIQNQFGKSKKESVKMANKICQRAGEKEMMNEMVNDMTENLADL